MNSTHLGTFLTVAALVGVAATPVAAQAAQPSARAADTCSLRLLTTKAVNLQHDAKGTDEVRAQLGNTTGRVRPYTLGQRRNTLSDATEIFTGDTQVSLEVEVRGGLWLRIDTRGIRCEDRTRDLVMRSTDATYKTRAVLEVLP